MRMILGLMLGVFGCCGQARCEQFTVEVIPRFTVVVAPLKIVVVEAPPVVKRREWYLVSEVWCGPCVAAKKRFLALGWSAANIITLDECHRRFGFRPKSVPYEFEEPIKDDAKKSNKQTMQKMSHSEMVALHNRLHGGGYWTWTGDLATHLETEHNQTLQRN